MKTLSTIFLLLCVTIAKGQAKFDSSKVDNILFNNNFENNISIIDTQIAKTIESIDKNINGIVDSLFNYKALKHTIISSPAIEVRKLVNSVVAMKLIFADSLSFNYLQFWNQFNNDTSKFLSNSTVQDKLELYFPNQEFPEIMAVIYPRDACNTSKLKNILFYNNSLDIKIDSLRKSINKSGRSKLYNYLSSNYDYFSIEKKHFEAKAIRIKTITLSPDNLSYAGLDIYGAHYLLTFDKNDNWRVIEIKKLWVY